MRFLVQNKVYSHMVVLTLPLGAYSFIIRPQWTWFDCGNSNQWNYFCSSAFSLYGSSDEQMKKGSFNVLWSCSISFCPYFILALRLIPALRDVNGYAVNIVRYLEWISIYPALILCIGEITKTQKLVKKASTYDYIYWL